MAIIFFFRTLTDFLQEYSIKKLPEELANSGYSRKE